MDKDKILKVMNLGCCDENEAIELLKKSNNDVIEAVALKFNVPQPKKKVQDSTQTFFSQVRKDMAEVERLCTKRLAISNQDELLEYSEKQDHLSKTSQ